MRKNASCIHTFFFFFNQRKKYVLICSDGFCVRTWKVGRKYRCSDCMCFVFLFMFPASRDELINHRPSWLNKPFCWDNSFCILQQVSQRRWDIAAFTSPCHFTAVRMALHQQILFLFTALCTFAALPCPWPRGPWSGTGSSLWVTTAPRSQHADSMDPKNNSPVFLHPHFPLLSCSRTRLV